MKHIVLNAYTTYRIAQIERDQTTTNIFLFFHLSVHRTLYDSPYILSCQHSNRLYLQLRWHCKHARWLHIDGLAVASFPPLLKYQYGSINRNLLKKQ